MRSLFAIYCLTASFWCLAQCLTPPPKTYTVLGVTGGGKSTLIFYSFDADGAKIGEYDSTTSTVERFVAGPKALPPFQGSVVFDTPGLMDNRGISDQQVLTNITSYYLRDLTGWGSSTATAIPTTQRIDGFFVLAPVTEQRLQLNQVLSRYISAFSPSFLKSAIVLITLNNVLPKSDSDMQMIRSRAGHCCGATLRTQRSQQAAQGHRGDLPAAHRRPRQHRHVPGALGRDAREHGPAHRVCERASPGRADQVRRMQGGGESLRRREGVHTQHGQGAGVGPGGPGAPGGREARPAGGGPHRGQEAQERPGLLLGEGRGRVRDAPHRHVRYNRH